MSAIGVTVTYAGNRFDPVDSENDLSLFVLQSAVQEFRYQFDASQDEPNRVDIQIKPA